MKLNIINQSDIRLPRAYMQWWAVELSKVLKRKNGHQTKNLNLNLAFLDEMAAKKLNKQFRGKNKATDVLSFDAIEESDLGDLVFCSEVLLKQAKEHGLPVREELAYLLTHGVLHLLGYEHEYGGKEAEIMLSLQDEVFDFLRRKWQSRNR